MKIYEYNFNNTNLPLELKQTVNIYKTTHLENRTYNKFLYNTILNFEKTKIFALINKSNIMVSYAFLFKVKKEYEKTFNLPNQTYIIREVTTLPQFRRKGYCKKLMNWINNYYKDKFIFLEVNGTNTKALKCYSFLKSYTNNNLQVYYDKFHLETIKWINSMDSNSKQIMLNEMPHIISKFLLFSN